MRHLIGKAKGSGLFSATPFRRSGAVSLPAGFSLPAGTPHPVRVAVAWALRQRGAPYVQQVHEGRPVPSGQIAPGGLLVQAPRTGDVVKVSRVADRRRKLTSVRRVVG